MKIKRIEVGILKTNCYVLFQDGKSLVIDPGDEVDKIVKAIGNSNLVGILITHRHFDHIGALNELLELYPVKVLEFKNLEEREHYVQEFRFRVIYTKGHTKDSVSYYFYQYKLLFSGDFLFKGTIGRIDFRGSNYIEMEKSITKIKKYKDNVIVFPGHGDSTTIGLEKNVNEFFKMLD